MRQSMWIRMIWISISLVMLVACNHVATNNQPNENTNNHQAENNDVEDVLENNQEDQKDETTNHDADNQDDMEQNHHEQIDDELVIDVFKDDSIAVLVNKHFSLDENYVPNDLVPVEVPTILENPEVNQLRKEAADALKEMFTVAKESGIHLYARSGYRSYQTQVYLFNSYAEQHGEEAANRFSAQPGHSEHQTGLVMDVTSESVNFQLEEAFGETEEGKWLSDHAHEFGFIIRYPEGMEEITGYVYEPWHIRYLGVDLATRVYESGLTYEEFLEKEGIIHGVHAE